MHSTANHAHRTKTENRCHCPMRFTHRPPLLLHCYPPHRTKKGNRCHQPRRCTHRPSLLVQVINILTIGSPTGVGGFFPTGLVGAINTPAGYNLSASGTQAFAGAAQDGEVSHLQPPLTIADMTIMTSSLSVWFPDWGLPEARPHDCRTLKLLSSCTHSSQILLGLMARAGVPSAFTCAYLMIGETRIGSTTLMFYSLQMLCMVVLCPLILGCLCRELHLFQRSC